MGVVVHFRRYSLAGKPDLTEGTTMKINTADMALAARHEAWQARETETRMSAWVDPRQGPGGSRPGIAVEIVERSRVELSSAGRSLLMSSQSGGRPQIAAQDAGPEPRTAPEAVSCDAAEPVTETELPSKLRLLKDLVEAMTGRKLLVFSSAALSAQAPAEPSAPPPASDTAGGDGAAPQRAGWGIEFDHREVSERYERSDFSASGRVSLEDGRELNFDFMLSMEHYEREETNVSIRAGDQRVKDPLILNLDKTAPTATGETIRFDLIAGGDEEGLPLLRGAAYLALDGNGNGRIDSGKELFGPQTDDGFAELARLDQDRNGWIDESDAAFAQLRLWRPDANGVGSLQTLADAGVGALYLGKVDTPFTLRTGDGGIAGAVRSSGVFLKENGEPGALQQIDVAV